MRRYLQLVATVGMASLCACNSTSYKVAPSTRKSDVHVSKISEHVAKAQVTVKQQKTKIKSIWDDLNHAKLAAVDLGTALENAQLTLKAREYAKTDDWLISARLSYIKLTITHAQMVDKIVELQKDNDIIAGELEEAQKEVDEVRKANAELDKVVAEMALQGAKDRAIVEQGEWLFGFGFYIVGTKRLLTHALWGSLILLVVWALVALVALWFGGPLLARTVLSWPGKIFRWIRKRPADPPSH